MKSTFIDLFSGTGAFSYVLEKNNYECVFANDLLQESKVIYELNNKKNIFHLEDINNIKIEETIPKFDILTGGFNCQPFSIAGKRLGFRDNRTNSFWKIIEILNYHKPQIFILENVKNLLSHDGKKTFITIKKSLEDAGYYIKYKVLDTGKISGVPQHRERLYIVGFLDKNKYHKFNLDFEEKVNKNIVNFLEKDIHEKYYYSDKYKVFGKIQNEIIKNIDENICYQYRRHYVRENKNNVCPTLTANMGGGGHNVPLIKDSKGIRKLPPRECFNLQGFPNSYMLPKISDSKLYSLAGNAISIPILELIINKIKQL